MVTFGRFILLALATVGLSVSAYADMTPTAERDTALAAVWSCEQTGVSLADLVGEFALPSAIDFDWQAAGLAPVPQPEPVAEGPAVVVLSDRQDSLTLCLYALMGLGLCKSAPWVRKFSFGVVPQWYHDGGPWQIGHSFAASPDGCCPAPVCFVQPEAPHKNLSPQYAWGAVTSLWRHSQATPITLAGRAPPAVS
jgi:hypothetical protein